MSVLSMGCPVCEGNDFTLSPGVFDDHYGEHTCYQLSRCSGCGQVAIAPHPLLFILFSRMRKA